MRQKYIVGGLVLFSLSLIGLGYILMFMPHILGLCTNYPPGSCYDSNIIFGIGGPLYRGIRVLPFLFLLLFFIRPDVFKLWWKFAIPFALFALYTILGTSPEGASGGWIYSGPTRTEVTYFFSLWLLSSSLILFTTKTFRPHWRAYFTIPAALVFSFLGLLLAGVRSFLI